MTDPGNHKKLMRASTLFLSVRRSSEDTDVFMMSLAFNNEIGASLFMKSGTGTQTKANY